ncbi:MAG TPA: DUF2164 family protein [Patescibacteria group bacterium]|nr:DUF2164 family protein [Patescibacteria group bacterium]
MKPVELEEAVWHDLIREIKIHFFQERDEDLSDFQAENLLRVIVQVIGPALYNQGILDAHRFMAEKVEDLLGLEKITR